MALDKDFLKKHDISGINPGRRNTQEERHDLFCIIIQKNPGIRHNPILRIVQILGAMAKKTAENELKNLEELGLILATKEGYNYKYYEMKLHPSEENMKKLLQDFLNDLEKTIEVLEKKYTKIFSIGRARIIALLLLYLNSFYPLITIFGKTLTSPWFKKQKIILDKLIDRTYNIVDSNESFFVGVYLISILNKENKIENDLNYLLKQIK